jgi:hypothetical protein
VEEEGVGKRVQKISGRMRSGKRKQGEG